MNSHEQKRKIDSNAHCCVIQMRITWIRHYNGLKAIGVFNCVSGVINARSNICRDMMFCGRLQLTHLSHSAIQVIRINWVFVLELIWFPWERKSLPVLHIFFQTRLPTMRILRKQQAHGDNGARCNENIRCRRRKTREQKARMGLMEIGDPFIIMSTSSIDFIIKFIVSCSIPKSQHKSYDLLIVLGSISMHSRTQKYGNFSESSNILPIVSFLCVDATMASGAIIQIYSNNNRFVNSDPIRFACFRMTPSPTCMQKMYPA